MTRYRVAIIGAGAAGTTAAYRIWRGLGAGAGLDGQAELGGQAGLDGRAELGEYAEITVFEQLGQAGGRARCVDFAGSRVEIGASLLHSFGKIGKELMKLTGCKRAAPGFSVDQDSPDDSYGFLTDKGFSVLTSSSRKAMAAAVLGYIGPASAMKVLRDAKEKIAKWQQVYQLLEGLQAFDSPRQLADGEAFDSPQQLLAALGLEGLAQVSVRQYLDGLGVNSRMANHIIEPVIKFMYNQGADVDALAGLVALAGAGLAGGKLFAINNGNFRVYDKTLRHIGAKLRFKTEVKSIRRQAGADGAGNEGAGHGCGRLGYELVCADGSAESFDAVVLAAPYASGALEISVGGDGQGNGGAGLPGGGLPGGDGQGNGGAGLLGGSSLLGAGLPNVAVPYFDAHVTLVAGNLNPAYFKAKPTKAGKTGKALPNVIFTANTAAVPFNSLSIGGFSPSFDKPIYKIVSAEQPLTEPALSSIFAEVDETCHFSWRKACPMLMPDAEPLPFVLAPGLFYACALDSLASTLEVASIGGWNSGSLTLRYLEGLPPVVTGGRDERGNP